MELGVADVLKGGEFINEVQTAVSCINSSFNSSADIKVRNYHGSFGSSASANEICKCDVSILHISEEQSDSARDLDWKRVVSDSPAESIRILVSTSGFQDTVGIDAAADNPIVLRLSQPTPIGEDSWLEILQALMLTSNQEELQKGRLPDRLRAHFSTIELRYLPALTILCQGALAARSASVDTHSDVVEEALDRMGWSDLPERTRDNLSPNPGLVEDDSGWWSDPFDGSDLQEEVDAEWEETSSRSSSGFQSASKREEDKNVVDRLISCIEKGKTPELDTVAEVYLALARRLD